MSLPFPVKILSRILALPLFFLLLPPMAAGADMAGARAKIAREAASIESIDAEFTQEKHLSVFKEVVKARGRFAYARPDRLRWELLEPVKSGFVLRGAEGERWHEMAGKRESFSSERNPVMKATAAQLLAWATADFAALEAQYEMELLAAEPARFSLKPRSQALRNAIEAVEITFAADNRNIREVTVREKNGDWTRMVFVNPKINAPLPPDLFR